MAEGFSRPTDIVPAATGIRSDASAGRAGDPGLDTSRFGGVIEDYGPRLIRFLEIRTGSRSDAQDLAQEAYFRLCRVKNPELIREPEAYLFRIASNLVGELMLGKRKQPSVVGLHGEEAEVAVGDEGSFYSHLENRSELRKLEEILTELPPLYQAVLLMRKRDGFSHAEIAEKLSISQHTVHKYLTRALFRCRTLWVERYDD